MERMLCTQCAAVAYSAAARRLVENGEPCPRCGGPLMLEEDAARERAEKPSGD